MTNTLFARPFSNQGFPSFSEDTCADVNRNENYTRIFDNTSKAQIVSDESGKLTHAMTGNFPQNLGNVDSSASLISDPSGGGRTADQTAFTEFELPCPSDGHTSNPSTHSSNFFADRVKTINRSTPASSSFSSMNHNASVHAVCSNMDSTDSSSAHYQGDSQFGSKEDRASYDSQGSDFEQTRNTENKLSSHMGKSPDDSASDAQPENSNNKSSEDIDVDVGSARMTRVDWRWAAKKGFWDKEKRCWIESAGGQAAYILQRTKRIKLREQRVARQAKAMERVVPVQNLPFRSGIMEELPYTIEGDPWTECMQQASKKAHVDNTSKMMHNATSSSSFWNSSQGKNVGRAITDLCKNSFQQPGEATFTSGFLSQDRFNTFAGVGDNSHRAGGGHHSGGSNSAVFSSGSKNIFSALSASAAAAPSGLAVGQKASRVAGFDKPSQHHHQQHSHHQQHHHSHQSGNGAVSAGGMDSRGFRDDSDSSLAAGQGVFAAAVLPSLRPMAHATAASHAQPAAATNDSLGLQGVSHHQHTHSQHHHHHHHHHPSESALAATAGYGFAAPQPRGLTAQPMAEVSTAAAGFGAHDFAPGGGGGGGAGLSFGLPLDGPLAGGFGFNPAAGSHLFAAAGDACFGGASAGGGSSSMGRLQWSSGDFAGAAAAGGGSSAGGWGGLRGGGEPPHGPTAAAASFSAGAAFGGFDCVGSLSHVFDGPSW